MYTLIDENLYIDYWPNTLIRITYNVAFNDNIYPKGWYTTNGNLEVWEVGQLLGGN